MKISLIGCAGIGRAHAISILRTGNTLHGMIDIHPFALDYYVPEDERDEWPVLLVNRWADIYETYNLHSIQQPREFYVSKGTEATENSPRFRQIVCESDMIIIASPTDTHEFWLDAIHNHTAPGKYTKVLCEKPVGRLTDLSKYTSISFVNPCEWVYHPLLPHIKDIYSITDSHNEKESKDFKELLWDLGPHSVAIALYHGLASKEELTSECTEIYYDPLSFMEIKVRAPKLHITISYNNKNKLTQDIPSILLNWFGGIDGKCPATVLRWNDLFDISLLRSFSPDFDPLKDRSLIEQVNQVLNSWDEDIDHRMLEHIDIYRRHGGSKNPSRVVNKPVGIEPDNPVDLLVPGSDRLSKVYCGWVNYTRIKDAKEKEAREKEK